MDFVIAALAVFDVAASNLSTVSQYDVPVLIGRSVRSYASGLFGLYFLLSGGEIG